MERGITWVENYVRVYFTIYIDGGHGWLMRMLMGSIEAHSCLRVRGAEEQLPL